MIVLGTCGHVDHGKSSLLRALTGMEPDRLPEEKKRGMTIDLGFVWLDTVRGDRVGIVDVPGHAGYVGNMIAGVMGIDAFLFIVAADDGWMPQSQEHLDVLRSFGIRRGLGIVTKVDLVDEARVREVELVLAEKLKEGFGAGFPIARFSTARPESLASVRMGVESLASSLPRPAPDGTGRLWIDRVFTPKGQGIVCTGTLRDGALSEGDVVSLWPEGLTATVRGLQSYHQTQKTIQPVSRLAIGLSRIKPEQVKRGQLLIRGESAWTTKTADAWVRYFQKPKARAARYAVHFGTRKDVALVVPMGKAAEPDALFVRLKFTRAVPLRAGDRFLLRASGGDKTLGAGVIIDSASLAKTHARALEGLAEWTRGPAALVKIEARERVIVDSAGLALRSTWSREEIATTARELALMEIAPGVFADELTWGIALESLAKTLAPKGRAGQAEREVRRELVKALGVGLPAVDVVIAQALRLKKLTRKGASLILPEARDPAEEARRAKVLALIGTEPAPFATAPADLKKTVRAMASDGEVVSLGEEHFWTVESYAVARAKVEALLREKGEATTSDLKNLLGMSRKFAVFVLEGLDRDRVTYLKDGVRRLLKGS